MGCLASPLARLCWTILIVSAAACEKGQLPHYPDADVIEPVLIKAMSDAVALPPHGSRRLLFRLLGAQDEPVPGAVISFTIVDDPETPGSGGARLSLSSGLTDEQGYVTLQVIAGTGSDDQKPLAFRVRASAADIFSILPVFVTSGVLASAEIVPEVEKASTGEDACTSISLNFYDDTLCADLSWPPPAHGIRPERTLLPDTSFEFTNVVTSGVHAVLAVARGARDRVVAKGCADLPGNSLTPSQVMRVYLPLTRMHVSPVGTYQVNAQFSLPTQQPGTNKLREQWKVLSARTCDPASIWLDCTIDALSGDSLVDPLDCQPVAGEEGALGALLNARRSTSGSGRACASQLDISGRSSLDAKTYALFPNGILTLLSLATLPDELSTALSRLSLQSTLTVVESGLANVLNIEHSLDSLTLSNVSGATPVLAEEMGLPVRDVWFASRQSGAGVLDLSSHGFTLHLGSLARLVYFKTSLATRLGLADAGAFISALFNRAGRNTDSTMLLGCDALDSLLCEEASLNRGCIKSACEAGLEKLAQRLDSSFAILDGPGLDFFLSGSAPLVDTNNDWQADELSSTFMTATFNAQMPGGATGRWSATRISPSSP